VERRVRAETARRSVRIGPASTELCRAVGPASWAVLIEMMQRSAGDGDQVVAQVSIRSLASSLGLAKDTVARAVRRLRDLGVIVAVQARTSSGVFDAGSYRLAVPVACMSVACPSRPAAAPSSVRSASARSASARPSSARPSSARRSSGQLALSLEA
jgi:DNA-binding transcriptional MocR family regulator